MENIQLYEYNKDEIKSSLSLDDIFSVLEEFHAEPVIKGDTIVCRTICHNHIHDANASRKLYYYGNTQLFRCFTGCEEPLFDVFELVLRIKNREEDMGWELPQAIDYIARKFGYSPQSTQEVLNMDNLQDWKVLERYERIKDINIETQEIELQEYDNTCLSHLPQPVISPWLEEGMTQDALIRHNIRYDPKNAGIVIPHYDINNRLIGIRERTMVEENEKYGKYRPAYIHGKLYNHPLSYNLYNINNSKDNIRRYKKAFVFEGEKSCLLYGSYFGKENDISVATCGQSLLKYQMELLYNNGAEEIIIAWDREGEKDNKHDYVKKFYNLQKKYGNFYHISFIYDKDGKYLNYKMSPIDAGKDIFLKLYKERIALY